MSFLDAWCNLVWCHNACVTYHFTTLRRVIWTTIRFLHEAVWASGFDNPGVRSVFCCWRCLSFVSVLIKTTYDSDLKNWTDPGVNTDPCNEKTNVRAGVFLQNSWPLQNSKYILCTSLLSPVDEVEHRHEDESIFKFFWTCLTNCHFVLNLLENLQCRVSWENIPLELNWFFISSN